MAEWDPLSDPPEAKESGEADGGVAALLGLWSPDGLVPIEGTQRKARHGGGGVTPPLGGGGGVRGGSMGFPSGAEEVDRASVTVL